MKVFDVRELSYSYNGIKALDNVSFDVRKGENLSIIGANGSGKSTLLYILNGLLKPVSGEVSVFGINICNSYPSSLRQRVSLLFQNTQAQLFSLSVWDELCFGPLQLSLKKAEVRDRVEDILSMLRIEHLRNRSPWELSVGEMKKVALGTCLSVNPDVLLLDEPLSGLDPRTQVEILKLIIALREAGKTIITATHDLHLIEDISERTVVLNEDHKVVIEGKPWQILDNHDLLLSVNLIHKHAHKHIWYVHEHSHFACHQHEHIIINPIKEETEMKDVEKLKKLIEHWKEHNSEHAKTYIEWAEKAKEIKRDDLSIILRGIAERTKAIEELFKKAEDALNFP